MYHWPFGTFEYAPRPVRGISRDVAGRFDRALYRALSRAGYPDLYGKTVLEADAVFGRMNTQTLQAIAGSLLREATLEGLRFAANTKFHCIVMCIVDVLYRRRAYVP